jgi:hypothetical protein
LFLLGGVLLVASLRGSGSDAASQQPAAAPAIAPVAAALARNPSWVEDGYGKSAEDAREVALKKSQDALAEYLTRNYGRLDWGPVTGPRSRLEEWGVLREEKPPEQMDLPGESAQHVQVRVEITERYVREVQKLAREERMQHRHLLLARVLAGLVALLVVVAGYLRLEDATRGYYTTLLRVLAIGVLVVAGVGLLVIG